MSLKYEKFLLFGDSITQFAFNTKMDDNKPDQFSLGAALVNAYTRRLDIVQRGFSGYNTRWALKLLPRILENESPGIVMSTLYFGSNDACHGGHQKVELPEFKDNVKRLLDLFRSKGIKPILVGPALFDKDNWNPKKADEVAQGYVRSNENNKLYSDALQEIADKEQIPFVNLYDAFSREGGSEWRDLLCDGLHYTGKGYEIFYNELMKAIRTHYPELAPESLPFKYPEWRQISESGDEIEGYS